MRERAELAAHKTDVGPVDVAVDDVRDDVADIFAPDMIGSRDERRKVIAAKAEQVRAFVHARPRSFECSREDAGGIGIDARKARLERPLVVDEKFDAIRMRFGLVAHEAAPSMRENPCRMRTPSEATSIGGAIHSSVRYSS